jgi:hypothetical protein
MTGVLAWLPDKDQEVRIAACKRGRLKEVHPMIALTPASCEVAWSKAYELGLRDAARIFAGFELSPEQLKAIAADAGFSQPIQAGPLQSGPLQGMSTRRSTAPGRRSSAALTKRTAVRVRRGQACEVEAARIAELRSDRTGSPHEVVRLPGGLYGVRKVLRGAKPSRPR